MGALQARPPRRSHPGRRGAGHEPRPVGRWCRRSPRISSPARAPRARRARSSRSATTSSRSSVSRAPRRRCWSRCSASSSGRSRTRSEAFVARPLFLSFRSTREVLHAVDTVFGDELADEDHRLDLRGAFARIAPNEPGHVVLLPRTVRQKAEEPEDWTAPYDAPSAAETVLAENIADEIARISGTTLPSGKRVRDGEILILVRRRDAFAAAMNRALRKRQIPTAGADRIPVSTHIAVLDLLALADVMLLPEDDLQLAALPEEPAARHDRGRADAARDRTASGDERFGRALQDAPDGCRIARAAEEAARAGARWPTRSRRSASSPRSSGRTAAGAPSARGSAARRTTCSTRF